MKQQHNAAVICFDRGEEIGRDTLPNWSKKLEIPYHTIYAGMKLGNTIAGRYKFVKVTPPKEAEDGTIISSLAEANKTARTAGKSYGQMRAEKYLQEHPIIPPREEPEEQEEEMEPMLEDEVMEDLDWNPVMTMREFTEAYAGEANFDLYIREPDDELVCSIPGGSPVLPIFNDLAVTGFMIEPGTSDTMRIYVKMEDPE